MCLFATHPVFDPTLALRGRGLGRLLEGLYNGDPVAWTITGVVIAISIGIAIYKHYNGDDD